VAEGADTHSSELQLLLKAFSLIGVGMVIVAVALATALYLREAIRVLKIRNSRVTRSLDTLLIPLIIVFAILVFVTFTE